MANDPAVACPQCGHENRAAAEWCANCRVDLKWAPNYGSQYRKAGDATRPPLILLSEDEPAMVAMFTLILNRAGYWTAWTPNASSTLDSAERLRPDLIVTDIWKPDMDGFELIALLKADPVLRDIPVIILSTKADAELLERGREVGAAEYLTGPLSHFDLLAAVARVLGGRPLPLVLFLVEGSVPNVHHPLREKGYQSWRLSKTEDLFYRAEQLDPEVIAVAFRLAWPGGLYVLARLKAEPTLRHIPVVMLADELEPTVEQSALELGASAVHTGPLDAETLQEVFRAVLEDR